MTENREIEAKFLEIDKEEIKKKLQLLGAKDLGEVLIREVVIYDKDLKWRDGEKKFIRLRESRNKIYLTYKNRFSDKLGGTEEIEFEISDLEKAIALFEEIGFVAYRHQEKKRHTFILGDVTIDIDTWPNIPTYAEIEGPGEQKIKKVATDLGFDWSKAHFENARIIIEKIYSVPVGKMKWFMFDDSK